MLDEDVLLPVVGETLVEGGILILSDLLWVSHPVWIGFVLIHEIPFLQSYVWFVLRPVS